jgi:hypothetical protein
MKNALRSLAFCALCFLPAAAQDFARQTISTTTYTTPVLQMRFSPFAFNPPILFDIGGTAGTQNIFQVVPLNTANTVTFNVAAPGQATTYKFTDPGGANGTIPFLEAAQTFSGNQSFSGNVTIAVSKLLTLNATTAQIALGAAAHLTNLTFTAPAAATLGITFPDSGVATSTINYAVFTDCGNATTCAGTTVSSTVKLVKGICTASSATTCTVASIPAFTSSTSYVCNVTDGTTAANNALRITYVSSSSFTITTTSSSDAFSYMCMGT